MLHKEYKAIVSETLTRAFSEKRYVIVDVKTHEVLDNNKGEGYRTADKALTKYELKKHGRIVNHAKDIAKKRHDRLKDNSSHIEDDYEEVI